MPKAIIGLLLATLIVLVPLLHAADKIDINKATVEDLSKIPSIGPKIAKQIVEYRKIKGRFESINELKEINEIGPKRFEAIKEWVFVEQDKE